MEVGLIQPSSDISTTEPERVPPHHHSKILGLSTFGRFRWEMREDVRRILIYVIDTECRLVSRIRSIHPTEAIIISLFDGERTVEAVEKLLSYLFRIDRLEACKTVGRVLNKWEEALAPVSQAGSPRAVYDPMDFVLPSDIVDLDTIRLYKPITTSIRVSDDCMRDCVYCNVQKRKTKDVNLLSVDRWERLAEEAAELGIVSIQLGGGDPFMRKELLEIVEIFFKNGLPVMASTKSHVSKRKARRLAEIGVHRMQVSIDAPTPHLADYMTKSPGYFTQVESTIENFREHGIRVRSNSVLTRHNVRSAPDLVEWLIDRGIDIIRVTPYGLSCYVDNADSLFVEDDDIQWVADEVKKIQEKNPELDIAVSATRPTDESPKERRQRF